MAVSTARQWRRRDSDCTHSFRRVQASLRESLTDMAVRLAEPPNPALAAPVRMEKFVIDGGVPLRGTVVPAGNKNGALPILAASVLTTEEVVVRNVPRIRDVEAMLRVLRGIGVTVDWRDENEVCLCAAGVDPEAHIDRDHATRIRASFLLAGPLLARFGHADMPPPVGDVIGRPRLDPHLPAFLALATQCSGSVLVHEWMFENRMIFTDKLVSMGADIVLCDPHRAIVTGPARLRGERLSSPDIRAGLAMLSAALCASGRSEIQNIREIDRGYERIDERLRELGAQIERVATEPATV